MKKLAFEILGNQPDPLVKECASGVGCSRKSTVEILVQWGAPPDTYHLFLCDEHAQVLRHAREILAFAVDMENDQEFKLNEWLEREALIEKWARVYAERPAASELDPQALAKNAYEFAHAMIGRKQRYESVLHGAEFEQKRGKGDLTGRLKTYYHDDALLEKASEYGGW